MRIGVVSDTHNNLSNVGKIVEIFNAHGVDRVIHTGDITQAKTLDIFAELNAPMYGVFGNNDQERETLETAIAKHGFNFCEPPLEINWHNRNLIVVHDPLQLDGHIGNRHDIALHGHTHLYRLESWGEQTTIFNPGECAGHMHGFNAIGIVDLTSLTTELLKF